MTASGAATFAVPEGGRRPWVVAHRGDSSMIPENTLAAFRAALEGPADAMEMDVQLSRDGVPMVFHDRTLERIGHGPRCMSDVDCGELQTLDAGSWKDARFASERIPTLHDVLSEVRTKALLLEWKVFDRERESRAADRLVRATLELLGTEAVVDRVLMLSFSREVLQMSKRLCPTLRTVLNVGCPPERADILAEWIRGVDAVDVNVNEFAPMDIEAVHAAQKPLLAYTCNTREQVEKALELGARGIITDCPAEVSAMLDDGKSEY